MRVKKITFNWHQAGSLGEGYTAYCKYEWFEVGRNGVTEIIENAPKDGMELWNFIICFEDGRTFRIFNPNAVEYFQSV